MRVQHSPQLVCSAFTWHSTGSCCGPGDSTDGNISQDLSLLTIRSGPSSCPRAPPFWTSLGPPSVLTPFNYLYTWLQPQKQQGGRSSLTKASQQRSPAFRLPRSHTQHPGVWTDSLNVTVSNTSGLYFETLLKCRPPAREASSQQQRAGLSPQVKRTHPQSGFLPAPATFITDPEESPYLSVPWFPRCTVRRPTFPSHCSSPQGQLHDCALCRSTKAKPGLSHHVAASNIRASPAGAGRSVLRYTSGCHDTRAEGPRQRLWPGTDWQQQDSPPAHSSCARLTGLMLSDLSLLKSWSSEHHPPYQAIATPNGKARYLNLFCFSFLSYAFPSDHCQPLLPAFCSDQPPPALRSHKPSSSPVGMQHEQKLGSAKRGLQGINARHCLLQWLCPWKYTD